MVVMEDILIKEKVLLVDDDENILNGIKRQLRNKVNIYFAASGLQGLDVMKQSGPFSVVISDMKMPEMNGIQFLQTVQKYYPNTIRAMLTGNVDIEIAISAINEGNIFRFITKPVSKETLLKVIYSCVQQYHLVHTEHVLLEHTLMGSIQMLMDVLSITNPMAFSRAQRIRYYVDKIVQRLGIQDTWQFKLAATLSQVGCVTIPAETLQKIFKNENSSEDEQSMYNNHPTIASSFLMNIPRLDDIGLMIARQNEIFDDHVKTSDNMDTVTLGAELLRAASDFEMHIWQGKTKQETLKILYSKQNLYNPRILAEMEHIPLPHIDSEIKSVFLDDLYTGLILEEDILSQSGHLIATKGQEVTSPMLIMLKNYFQQNSLEKKSIKVIMPDTGRQKI